mgnify:FL=1
MHLNAFVVNLVASWKVQLKMSYSNVSRLDMFNNKGSEISSYHGPEKLCVHYKDYYVGFRIKIKFYNKNYPVDRFMVHVILEYLLQKHRPKDRCVLHVTSILKIIQ